MYKTEISTAKWLIYDILGNIGWISYFIVLGKCLAEKLEFRRTVEKIEFYILDKTEKHIFYTKDVFFVANTLTIIYVLDSI